MIELCVFHYSIERVAINICCYITIVTVVNSYTRWLKLYRTSFQLQIFFQEFEVSFLSKKFDIANTQFYLSIFKYSILPVILLELLEIE